MIGRYVLKDGPNILDPTKRHDTQLNFLILMESWRKSKAVQT